jgi:HK97 family phage major capsid protein
LKNVSGKQTLAAATNGQAPTFDNFADAIALLEAVNVPRERMRIVVAPRNLSTLRKAKADTAGSYLWQDVGSAEPATIFGVPVVASASLATRPRAQAARSPTVRMCMTSTRSCSCGARRSSSRRPLEAVQLRSE